MDLVYTDVDRVDQGALLAYALDLSYGAEENNFELTLGDDSDLIPANAYIYIDGTEYGGVVDGIRVNAGSRKVVYTGRTWHGILNSKIIEPDAGEDHFVVSGDANEIIATVISRVGLPKLFSASSAQSGITVNNYKFYRFCKGYDGLVAMLGEYGAKLHIAWESRGVTLSAIPAEDYSSAPIDEDVAALSIEVCDNKVNHLVCLGAGELADRIVLHLYVDQNGDIGKTQYYTGLSEVAEIYENSASDDLEYDGTIRLQELRETDISQIKLGESNEIVFDIGDIVGATDYRTGIRIAQKVSQKIVKVNNNVVTIDYNVGG